MKKARVFLGITAMLITVGGTVAMKGLKNEPNLYVCSFPANLCIQSFYSTIPAGTQVAHVAVYYGVAGYTCGSLHCPEFKGPAYVNF
jgi:hypothetical protein